MHDVLAFLKDIDLGSHALNLLDLIQHADLCFVALVVSVLICLGYKMVSGNRAVFSWGLRLAALVFLVYGGVAYCYAETADATSLGLLAARAALLAGASLALTWIIFPVLVFVYAHLRLALTAFLVYAGYAIIVSGGEFQMDELPGIALRSLVAAGLAVIVAWIFQPVWLFLVARYGKPKPAAAAAPTPSYTDADLERLERKQRKLRKKLRRQRLDDDLDGDDEVQTMQVEMRRRRDKARLTVELTYAMSMSELNTQLPRDMFENWISRYLGDHLPPEDVEENSKQLQAILSQQKRITQQMSGINSGSQLEDLNHWFLDEQRRIQTDGNCDPAEKQRKLLDLQQMYTSLVNRLLGDHHAVVPLPYRPSGSAGEAM